MMNAYSSYPEIDNYILRCLNCPGERGQVMTDDGWDLADISCQLCDRFYGKGKLFLNNVG